MDPWPLWWEASALNTVPTMPCLPLPQKRLMFQALAHFSVGQEIVRSLWFKWTV